RWWRFWFRDRLWFWLQWRLGFRLDAGIRLGFRLWFRLRLGFRFLRDRRGIDRFDRLSGLGRFGRSGGFRVRKWIADGIRRRFGPARCGRHEDDGGAEGDQEKKGEDAFHG
ncbi:MAG: hypothetical protein J6V24_04835, partial [Clostridia bacterium]|nr:hypothetical protein [Clostridia bacterium]